MYCPKCHKSYDDGNVFCVDCGTRLIEGNGNVRKSNPIERHSSRFKTSNNKSDVRVNSQIRKVPPSNDKMDILILQNKELIRQNNRIIELLEKLAR